MRTTAPTRPAWDSPYLFRACNLCDFGTGPSEARACNHPLMTDRHAPTIPVQIARSSSRACGPEAQCMTVKGVKF